MLIIKSLSTSIIVTTAVLIIHLISNGPTITNGFSFPGGLQHRHRVIAKLPNKNGCSKLLSKSYSCCHGIDYSFLSPVNRLKEYSKEDLLDKDQLDYISGLVNRRSSARNGGDYELADSIRDQINALAVCTKDDGSKHGIIPEGYIVEIKDISRKEGGGSTWTLQIDQKEPIEWVDDDNIDNNEEIGGSSVLKIAHTALGLASWSSENKVPVDKATLDDLVIQAKERLRKTGASELRGRKAADAAFWFAMAGVTDEIKEKDFDNVKFSLFDALTFVCIEELRRFGQRSSCRAMDIMHMVERIAAAGIRSELTKSLQGIAAECLLVKDLSSTRGLMEKGIIDLLQKGDFDLHSERSLLWIWRFSTRQRKQQAFLKSASKHWESNVSKVEGGVNGKINIENTMIPWDAIFEDVSLPLVIDIGCGMGISILGLASTPFQDISSLNSRSVVASQWSQYNFLGADLAQLAINFASSVSYRWKLQGRVHFAVMSAEEVMQHVISSYPGPVELITIQFPTPFSFQENDINDVINQNDNVLNSVVNTGNKQLPKSAYNGFMVTKRLLLLTSMALNSSGKLLLQSNCEDVAVLMRNIAVEEAGFKTVELDNFTIKLESKSGELRKRTEKWIAAGGERAEGTCWSSIPLLPARGSTETEIACSLNGTPIHRCVLKVSHTSM